MRVREAVGIEQHAQRAPGPPSVCTSRVPGTRFNSISSGVRDALQLVGAGCGSALQSVRVTTGTSSMPLGLMMGGERAQLRRAPSRWLALMHVVQPHQRVQCAARRP